MKITLETSGGFAYLSGVGRPAVIDTSLLEAHVVKEIEELIERVRFFELPAIAEQPAEGAADFQTYVISFEDGARVHSVELTDPNRNLDLQRLTSMIQRTARRSRA